MTSFPTWCVWSQGTCPALSSCCQALRLKPARYYRSANLFVFVQTNHCHMHHTSWPYVHNYLHVLRQMLFPYSRLTEKVSPISSFFFISYQLFPLFLMSSTTWLNHSLLFLQIVILMLISASMFYQFSSHVQTTVIIPLLTIYMKLF